MRDNFCNTILAMKLDEDWGVFKADNRNVKSNTRESSRVVGLC